MAKNPSPLSDQNATRAAIAAGLALLTILAALGFEHIGGYVPCELCLNQRLPYYAGIPAALLLLILWKRLGPGLRFVFTLVLALLFAWGAYMGAFHAGIEWGFWPGPSSCTGLGESLSLDALSNLDAARVVPCDEAQVRFFGLSFAGLNAIAAAAITGFFAWSAAGQYSGSRKRV